jgi:hypothetical protein
MSIARKKIILKKEVRIKCCQEKIKIALTIIAQIER